MPDNDDFVYTKNVKNYSANPDDYPNDYMMLNGKAGNGILSLMNTYDQRAEGYWARHKLATTQEEHDEYLGLYDHYEGKLSAFKNAYEVIGIRVERWGRDPNNPWILATRKDCEYYNAHLDDDDDSVENEKNYHFWNEHGKNQWPAPESYDSDRTNANDKYRNLNTKDYAYNKTAYKSDGKKSSTTTGNSGLLSFDTFGGNL